MISATGNPALDLTEYYSRRVMSRYLCKKLEGALAPLFVIGITSLAVALMIEAAGISLHNGRQHQSRNRAPAHLAAINFSQLAKVVTHGGERHRLFEFFAVICKDVAHEAPEFGAFGVAYAELKNNARQGSQVGL